MTKRTRIPWKPLLIAVVFAGLAATYWYASPGRQTDSAGATIQLQSL